MSLVTDRINRINNYNNDNLNQRNNAENERIEGILEWQEFLKDRKRTLEVYSDFISKNEGFKSQIKQAREFIKNIESIIGYFEPTKFNTNSIGPELDDFLIKYRTFFRENSDSIWEATLTRFEEYIEEINHMESVLQLKKE